MNFRRGQFLPPHEAAESTRKLHSVLEKYPASGLLVLGDVIDEKDGWRRLPTSLLHQWRQICQKWQVTFLQGNHDQRSMPPFDAVCFEHICIGSMLFTHHPAKSRHPQIHGHLHPGVVIRTRAGARKLKCHVVDTNRMILSAFGALTGKFSVEDPVFHELIGEKARLYALGKQQIVQTRSAKRRPPR